jgi:hypothetical protein
MKKIAGGWPWAECSYRPMDGNISKKKEGCKPTFNRQL